MKMDPSRLALLQPITPRRPAFRSMLSTESSFRIQRDEGVFWCKISPVQWNLKLAALLVEKADSVLTVVFIESQSFKLAACERVEGMGDPKLLGFCSTNVCSPTPFPIISDIRSSSHYAITRKQKRCGANDCGLSKGFVVLSTL